MKNDNILYVNGCSYAYGQGVHKQESICKEQRFSRTLSDHLGFIEVNKALPGSSNSRIARRTLVDLIHYKPRLAIIVWSDPSRTEFMYTAPYYHNGKYPYELGQAKPSSLKGYPSEVSVYYNKLRSVEQEIMNTLYHMLAVKATADSISIPCIQLHFRENFSIDLRSALYSSNIRCRETVSEYLEILDYDELVYGIPGREMHSFEMLGGGYLDDTGHPDKASHDRISKWISNLIEEKGLL